MAGGMWMMWIGWLVPALLVLLLVLIVGRMRSSTARQAPQEPSVPPIGADSSTPADDDANSAQEATNRKSSHRDSISTTYHAPSIENARNQTAPSQGVGQAREDRERSRNHLAEQFVRGAIDEYEYERQLRALESTDQP